MSLTCSQIERNISRVRGNVADACARARRDPSEVSLLAVTKTADIGTIKAMVDAGLHDLAENRVQQLTQRSAELAGWLARRPAGSAPVRWHMIGHLQRNKVRQVLPIVASIHSIDSLRLAEEIDSRCEAVDRRLDVLLQVNCSKEPQKSGCAVGAAPHLAELISTLRNVRLAGLMTMAELSADQASSRGTFALLREIFDELRHQGVGGESFRHLSMGMSHDYPVAVEEGATILRIGSALLEPT